MDTKEYGFLVKSVDPDEGRFVGRASVYGVVDYGNDVVVAGAFAKSLARSNRVPVLSQHDTALGIGMGTLIDRADGLWIDVKLIMAIQQAREDFERVKAGIVTGLSIGYTVGKQRYRKDGVRELLEIDLAEVSLVTFPINGEARVVPSTIKRDERMFDQIWKDLDEKHDDDTALRKLAANHQRNPVGAQEVLMQGTVIAVTARGLQVKRDDGATVEAAARGWVRLGDRVQIDGDGGARKVAARPAFETKGAR